MLPRNRRDGVLKACPSNQSCYDGSHSYQLTAGLGAGRGCSPLRRELKQRVHKLLVVHVAEGLAAGMKRAILGKGDHVISGLADLLRPSEGRLDLAVTNQLGGEGAQQSLALVCSLVELAEALAMALQLEGPEVSAMRESNKGSGERIWQRKKSPAQPLACQ